MNTPDPALMQYFGTTDVFLEKNASEIPLLARLGMGILEYELAKRNRDSDLKQQLADGLRDEAVREYDKAKMQQADDNLRHTRAPVLVPAGSSLPVGWDEGMVRLASIAAVTGQELAKSAGVGPILSGLGTKAVGLAKGIGAAAKGAFSAAPPIAPAGMLDKAKKYLGGGLGVKSNLAVAGGTLAVGIGANKAISAGTREMARAPGPATYGTPTKGFGYQLPYGVNAFGTPQVGTQL